MKNIVFHLSRSSGIVATILVVFALLWGFLFSSRATGRRLRPNWWLDLHNWLGGLALSFTVIHVALALFDTNSGITIVRVFVPGATGDARWAITWGTISMYALVAVVFTTWPTRLTNRRSWRIVHLVSVPATVLAFLHAYQSGSDASRGIFQVGILAAAAVATYGLGLRLSTLRPARR